VLIAVVSANAGAGCWQAVSHYNRGFDLQIKGDLDGAITEYRRSDYPEAQAAIAEALKSNDQSW